MSWVTGSPEGPGSGVTPSPPVTGTVSISGCQRTLQQPRPGSSTSFSASLIASFDCSSSMTICSAFSMIDAAASMSFCGGRPGAGSGMPGIGGGGAPGSAPNGGGGGSGGGWGRWRRLQASDVDAYVEIVPAGGLTDW